MIVTRTGRDLRGVASPLGAFSRDELADALACARSTQEHVARFISDVEGELTLRGDPPPRAA
jgi:hypothetical protein